MRLSDNTNTDAKPQAAQKMLYGQRRLPRVSRAIVDELDARDREKSQSEQKAKQDK